MLQLVIKIINVIVHTVITMFIANIIVIIITMLTIKVHYHIDNTND